MDAEVNAAVEVRGINPQRNGIRNETMRIRVIGVYPVSAPEPCHLVELFVSKIDGDFDVGAITQEIIGRPRANWQVPYDEVFLNADGDGLRDPEKRDAQPADSEFRLAFFFHHLDFAAPTDHDRSFA